MKNQASISDDQLSCNKGCIIGQEERNKAGYVSNRALALYRAILDIPLALHCRHPCRRIII
jgi:hypothetical protein